MQAIKMYLRGVRGSFVVQAEERDEKSVTLSAEQAFDLLKLLLEHSQEILLQLRLSPIVENAEKNVLVVRAPHSEAS